MKNYLTKFNPKNNIIKARTGLSVLNKKIKVNLYIFNKKRLAGKPQVISDDDTKHRCKNCKTGFTGKYCYNCGQSAKITRLTWTSVIEQILGGFTNITRGFGFTIIELFTRPGYMINDFIRGKRVIYAKPFQMLFVLAAVYAIGSQLIYPDTLEKSGERPEIVQTTRNEADTTGKSILEKNVENAITRKLKKAKTGKDTAALNTIGQVQHRLTQRNLQNNDDKEIFDGKYNNFLKEVLNGFSEKHPYLNAAFKTIFKAFTTNRALSAILFLPFITMGMRLAFRKSKRNPHFNFVEMFFVNCYISCQSLIIAIILLPFYKESTDVHIIINIILSLWVLKELFGNNMLRTIRKYIFSYINTLFIIILLTLILAAVFMLAVYLSTL